MADEYGHIGKTLDDIKQQISSKIDEAARLLSTANTLEGMIGLPHSSLTDYIDSSASDSFVSANSNATLVAQRPVSAPSSGRGSSRGIKPDQFLGEPPLDAAKKYLAMVGHATHFDEIADAVQRGGAATKGDWREKLEMSLLKSVYEVVKVQEKTYGLISFYTDEQIQGLRGSRRKSETKPKSKRGKKPQREKTAKPAKAAANAVEPKAKSPTVAAPETTAHKPVDAADDSGQIH